MFWLIFFLIFSEIPYYKARSSRAKNHCVVTNIVVFKWVFLVVITMWPLRHHKNYFSDFLLFFICFADVSNTEYILDALSYFDQRLCLLVKVSRKRPRGQAALGYLLRDRRLVDRWWSVGIDLIFTIIFVFIISL